MEDLEDLENITVKEFFELQDEGKVAAYGVLKVWLKAKPSFLCYQAKPLGELQFGEVANLKEYLTEATFEGLIEAFRIVFGVKRSQYLRGDVVSFFPALNWLTEALGSLVQIENKMLSAEPDPLLEMAGAGRLAMFRELPTLAKLGKDYSQPPQVVETWSYNLVFSLMLLDKLEGEVRERYNELKTPSRNGNKK